MTGNNYCYIGFFDTAIGNNSSAIGVSLWLAEDMIEILNVFVEVFITS